MVVSYIPRTFSRFSNEHLVLTPQPGDEVEFVVVQNQKSRKMSACSLRKIWLVYSFTLRFIVCFPVSAFVRASREDRWGISQTNLFLSRGRTNRIRDLQYTVTNKCQLMPKLDGLGLC